MLATGLTESLADLGAAAGSVDARSQAGLAARADLPG
jgi:hypothetical protein